MIWDFHDRFDFQLRDRGIVTVQAVHIEHAVMLACEKTGLSRKQLREQAVVTKWPF